MTITAGIDLGSGAVKTVLFRVEDDDVEWLARHTDKIRQRDPLQLAESGYDTVLAEAGTGREEVDYVATTGDGENIDFRTGHFYSMTTHARGAIYLDPDVRSVLDIGALHGRAIRIDHRGKVLSYRMTSQCASGSGQFLENVARYLGVTLDDVGSLSCQARRPEAVSSICAVLAETDVINMVSRGIGTADILKGIHQSMAGRFIKLLRAIGAEDRVLITGGLSADEGLAEAMRETVEEDGLAMTIETHPHSIYAGALGAALWGGFRHRVLERRAVASAA